MVSAEHTAALRNKCLNLAKSCLVTASTPEPEGGARCVSSARRDLCGGRGEILVPTANIRPHQLLKSVAYQFSQGRKVVPLRLGVQFAFDGLPATSLFNLCHQNSRSSLNNQKTGSRRNCKPWIVGNQLQPNKNWRPNGKKLP